MDTVIDLTGLVGVLCLAVLALRADRYAYWITRLTNATKGEDIQKEWPQMKTVMDALVTEQSKWKPSLRYLLIGGSFLGALSYALGVYRDIFLHAPGTG